MSMRRSAAAVTMLAVLSCIAPRPARATQKFGPIQLSGNLQTMDIVRTPDVDTYQFIMNRNVAHIRLDYAWLQSGKFYNKYDIPFIDSSNLSVIWRGVYDSIYDTTPGFIQKEDIHGRAYSGNLTLDEYRRRRGFPSSVLKIDGIWRRSCRRPPTGGTRSGGTSGCSSSSTTSATCGSCRRTSSSGTGIPATGSPPRYP